MHRGAGNSPTKSLSGLEAKVLGKPIEIISNKLYWISDI